MPLERRYPFPVVAVVVALFTLGACERADDGRASSAATTTTSAVTSSTTLTTTPAPSTTAATSDSRPRFPPEAVQLRQGDRVFGVFVAVERNSSAPERMAQAKEEVRKAGYRVSPGATDINCDQGAREALGLTSGVDYFVEAVYFRTRQEAQQFVDAFEPGVVGTAEVTIYCRDGT